MQLLGLHPQTGGEVTVAVGSYGPYVRSGDRNASLPKVIIAFNVMHRKAEYLEAGKTLSLGSWPAGHGSA